MKIEGLDKFLNDLENYGKETVKSVSDTVLNSAVRVEVGAIRDAPQFIKSKIDKRIEEDGLTVFVGVQGSDPLPAYFEFGTGLSAKEILKDYPKEVKDLAWTFKRPKDGTLRGQPYLFPNLFKQQKDFIDRLRRIMNRTKRI